MMDKLTTTYVGIDKVEAHPNNVRQGDIGAIAQSLSQYGQYRPIVVQKSTNHILAGNHTWKAAKQLGWDKVAVTFVDVDDETALRILLVDNRANDLATYDDEQLAELLKLLAETELELAGTGFDGDDLDDLLFRLEGSAGFLTDGLTAQERKAEWENRGIRTIILPYPEAEWQDMAEKLGVLRERYGVENNADVVHKLVSDACA